jgi:glycosyltransferase involved in cell wall biosynthesis
LSKIILVGPAWPLRGGGMSTFNERLATEYQALGYEVEIVTFSLQYPRILFPGKSQMSEEEAPANLNIKVMINSVNPLSWYRTARYIAKQQPDYLIFRYWMPFMAPCLGQIARLSKRFGSKAKRLAIADNIIPHEKFPLSKPLTSFFLNQMDAVSTMSASVMEDLKAFQFTRPSQLLKHPLYDNYGQKVSRELALAELKLDPKFTYFLFFGFIRHYKGLDLLLQAFADARLKRHPVKLIIAGEFYENPDRYYRMVREHNLADRLVMMTQFIPDEQVKYLFSSASLVTQTYPHATQSGVTQVGFQFDTPMLVTNVGGLAELVADRKSGYVCDRNPIQIADCLLDFIENDRFATMSAEVAIKKQEFSWEVFARQLVG